MGKSGRRINWKIANRCEIIKVSKRGRDTLVKMRCDLNKKDIQKIKTAQEIIDES